jgi:hypothetical protein
MHRIYDEFSKTIHGGYVSVVARALSGSAFGYSQNEAMIKAILIEAQQGHSEGDIHNRSVLLGVLQNLAAVLWVDCHDFSDFHLLCISIEHQRLGLIKVGQSKHKRKLLDDVYN